MATTTDGCWFSRVAGITNIVNTIIAQTLVPYCNKRHWYGYTIQMVKNCMYLIATRNYSHLLCNVHCHHGHCHHHQYLNIYLNHVHQRHCQLHFNIAIKLTSPPSQLFQSSSLVNISPHHSHHHNHHRCRHHPHNHQQQHHQ